MAENDDNRPQWNYVRLRDTLLRDTLVRDTLWAATSSSMTGTTISLSENARKVLAIHKDAIEAFKVFNEQQKIKETSVIEKPKKTKKQLKKEMDEIQDSRARVLPGITNVISSTDTVNITYPQITSAQVRVDEWGWASSVVQSEHYTPVSVDMTTFGHFDWNSWATKITDQVNSIEKAHKDQIELKDKQIKKQDKIIKDLKESIMNLLQLTGQLEAKIAGLEKVIEQEVPKFDKVLCPQEQIGPKDLTPIPALLPKQLVFSNLTNS